MQLVQTGAVSSRLPSVMPSAVSSQQVPDLSTKGDISEYRGPSANNFPFTAMRLLGLAQLIVGLLILALTVVQLSLGYGNRFVFLACASVSAWAPLPAIAAGIVGLSISEKKYWQTHCLREAYFFLTAISGFFLIVLCFVMGIIGSYYYDITDIPPRENILYPSEDVVQDIFDEESDNLDKPSTYRAIIGGIIGLALLEIVINFVAILITCFCARTYKLRDKAIQRQLFGAHDPKVKYGKSGNVSGDQMAIVQVPSNNMVYPQPPPPESIYGGGTSPSVYVVQ